MSYVLIASQSDKEGVPQGDGDMSVYDFKEDGSKTFAEGEAVGPTDANASKKIIKLQGGHGTGKTGNLVLTFSRQGKHREFCSSTGKIFKTQGKYFLLYLLLQKACFPSHILKKF